MNYREIKEARKKAIAEAKANMKNPFKVGQIFYDSWGYEQTNIDFYQVIEVKPKSVVIREIKGDRKYDASFQSMSGKVFPLKDQFADDSIPLLKPLCVMVSNGKPEFYLKSKHGWISLYEKEEKGCSFSSYA